MRACEPSFGQAGTHGRMCLHAHKPLLLPSPATPVYESQYTNLGSGVCSTGGNRARLPYCQRQHYSKCKDYCDSDPTCTGYNPATHGSWCFVFYKSDSPPSSMFSSDCHNTGQGGLMDWQDGTEGGTCFRKNYHSTSKRVCCVSVLCTRALVRSCKHACKRSPCTRARTHAPTHSHSTLWGVSIPPSLGGLD